MGPTPSLLDAVGNTKQGRVSDACTAAEQARDLDPFGKEVRLLCPRFMALHSEDAGSQVTTSQQSHKKRILRKREAASQGFVYILQVSQSMTIQ